MRRPILFASIAAAVLFGVSCAKTESTAERLREMRVGVWVTTGGVYTVWTDQHYFVVSATGDSASTNIYCGASQVAFTDFGIARKQNMRLRQMGQNRPIIFNDYSVFREGSESSIEEIPLEIDTALFNPSTCVIENGVIYDSILEMTEEYILLATCDGDREKIFSNGRAVYLPSGGGEHWSFRIESVN